MNTLFIRIYVLLFISIFYFGFFNVGNKGHFELTPNGYYTPLVDAFLHGRVNILFPHHYDLSLFRGKWYMYWGPAPVLFILPFYLAGGIFSSDKIYTLVAGIANIFLFDFVLYAAKTYFKITLSLLSEIILLCSFAIVSPNFYLSFIGSVWATEQIIGVFYLLVFYFFYFTFLTKKRIWYLILSIIFFNLAWLSRYILIFHGVLFLYNPERSFFSIKGLVLCIKERNVLPFILYTRTFILISVLTSIFVSIFFLYNYAKFGNPFETGLRYQRDFRYLSVRKRNEIFSFSYVRHNAYYFFLHLPQFSLHKPFIRIDPEGNSIFIVYPCILFLIFLYAKLPKLDKKNRYFLLFAGIIIIITFVTLLCYFATGWKQFGMRFFLDIAPLVYLLLLFVIDDIPKYITIPLLIYGCMVQILGTISFYEHDIFL